MKYITGTLQDCECTCDAHTGTSCMACRNAHANGITSFYCRQDFYECFPSGARIWHTKCSIWDSRETAKCVTCGHIQAIEFQTNHDCGMCSDNEPAELTHHT